MKTVSGHLHINKTEVKNIRLLLEHVKSDLDYGEGGTYNKSKGKTNDIIFDEAAAKKAQLAISDLEWILDDANFK